MLGLKDGWPIAIDIQFDNSQSVAIYAGKITFDGNDYNYSNLFINTLGYGFTSKITVKVKISVTLAVTLI